MEKLRHCCALLSVAAVSFGASVAFFAGRGHADPVEPVASPTAASMKAHWQSATHELASLRVPAAKPKAVKKAARPKKVLRRRPKVVEHHIGASPSLYERTTSLKALRLQGCDAGRKRTNGLVVLDFGKPEYRAHAGYGTVTFANRFASNTAVTWAVQSFALGYSRCLPHGSNAHITLARGTSNYGIDVPSAYTSGRLWAAATIAIRSYLQLHHLDHVTAAAAIDAEPAWDRGFKRTYDWFRGYAHADRGVLLYNYGSLDGGVGGIWKLRQAYYVAGGMREARAVPEIYNRAMAREWAELARASMARYGQPIKLAGLMTQHWTSCSRCGYTARKAKSVLVGELARVRAGKAVPTRQLASITNIAAAR
jgi:hypothetical protein